MVVIRLPAQRAVPALEQREWWQAAACREVDPELFFPVATRGPAADEADRAKAVCFACEVRRECLQYALVTRQLHGIWGGTTEGERHLQPRRGRLDEVGYKALGRATI